MILEYDAFPCQLIQDRGFYLWVIITNCMKGLVIRKDDQEVGPGLPVPAAAGEKEGQQEAERCKYHAGGMDAEMMHKHF